MSSSRLVLKGNASEIDEEEGNLSTSGFEDIRDDVCDEHESPWCEDIREWLNVPCKTLLPVFGKLHVQIVHTAVLLVIAVVVTWTVSTIDGPVAGVPPPLENIVGWLALSYVLSALARLWIARDLMSCSTMGRLWEMVTDHEYVDPMRSHASVKSAIAHQREQALAESQRGLQSVVYVMAYLCPVVLAVLFGAAVFSEADNDRSTRFYFGCLLPSLASFYHGAHSMTAVGVATSLCKICVARFIEEMPDMSASCSWPKMPKGYWARKAEEYQEIDSLMTDLMAKAFNVLLLQISVFAALGWFTAFCAVLLMKSEPRMATAFCVAAMLFGCIILYQLYPVAGIHSLSHSKYAKSPGLLMRAMKCSAAEMDQLSRLEYTNFLHIVTELPLGAKLPILGMVTMEDLAGYAKVFAAGVPLAWTLTLTTVAGSTGK